VHTLLTEPLGSGESWLGEVTPRQLVVPWGTTTRAHRCAWHQIHFCMPAGLSKG